MIALPARVAAAAALLFALAACSREPDVAIYCALDEQHSRPLLEDYARQRSLQLRPRFDSEASKTVGLVSAIIEEQANPRTDVFWNNELAHTVRLAKLGLLAEYDSPAAADFPARWRDPQRRWTAFGARARILVINTRLLPDQKDWPKSIWDLCDPKWKGKVAVARPLLGTTLTHFTALRRRLGETEFERLLSGLFANDVQWLQSNGATLRATVDGSVVFALTDTDDYNVARTKGHPVACVFPDQGEGQLGTMLIPNSVAVLKGAPHPEAARKLCDFVLSREIEGKLAAGAGAQIPLRTGIPGPTDAMIPAFGKFREMDWDVEWTAENLAASNDLFAKRFGS